MTKTVFKPMKRAIEIASSPVDFSDHISAECEHMIKHGRLTDSNVPIHFTENPAHCCYYKQHGELYSTFALLGTQKYYEYVEGQHALQMWFADSLQASALIDHMQNSRLSWHEADLRSREEMASVRANHTRGMANQGTYTDYYELSHGTHNYSMSRGMIGLTERLSAKGIPNVLLSWECHGSLSKGRKPATYRRSEGNVEELDCRSVILEPKGVNINVENLDLPSSHKHLSPQLLASLERKLFKILEESRLEHNSDREAFHLVQDLFNQDIMQLPARFNTLAIVERLELREPMNTELLPSWRKPCNFTEADLSTIRIGGFLQLC